MANQISLYFIANNIIKIVGSKFLPLQKIVHSMHATLHEALALKI